MNADPSNHDKVVFPIAELVNFVVNHKLGTDGMQTPQAKRHVIYERAGDSPNFQPQGKLNQHPSYTDILSGDAHIADTLEKLRASPQWEEMLIIVTYDENDGYWDHVALDKIYRSD